MTLSHTDKQPHPAPAGCTQQHMEFLGMNLGERSYPAPRRVLLGAIHAPTEVIEVTEVTFGGSL